MDRVNIDRFEKLLVNEYSIYYYEFKDQYSKIDKDGRYIENSVSDHELIGIMLIELLKINDVHIEQFSGDSSFPYEALRKSVEAIEW